MAGRGRALLFPSLLLVLPAARADEGGVAAWPLRRVLSGQVAPTSAPAAPQWDLVSRQYSPAAGGAVLPSSVTTLHYGNDGALLMLRLVNDSMWRRLRQSDGSLELELRWPLDPGLPPLRWRQTSVPYREAPAEGYVPVSVPLPGSRELNTHFRGVAATPSTAAAADGCGGCGWPAVGAHVATAEGLLAGPCSAANESEPLWDGDVSPSTPAPNVLNSTSPESGALCFPVAAVELWVKRPVVGPTAANAWRSARVTEPVNITGAAGCALDGDSFVPTDDGLVSVDGQTGEATYVVGGQRLGSQEEWEPCAVPGHAFQASCSAEVFTAGEGSAWCVDGTRQLGPRALNLTGASGIGLPVPASAAPVGEDDFTVALWAQLWTDTSDQVLLSIQAPVSPYRGVVLRYLHSSNAFQCALDSTGASAVSAELSGTPRDSHHVACIRRRNRLTLVVDGVRAAQSTPTPVAVPVFAAAGSVGRTAPAAYSARGSDVAAEGIIEDVRIYRRALSDEDLRRLTHCGENAGGTATPGRPHPGVKGAACDPARGTVYYGVRGCVMGYEPSTRRTRLVAGSCGVSGPGWGEQPTDPSTLRLRSVRQVHLAGDWLLIVDTAPQWAFVSVADETEAPRWIGADEFADSAATAPDPQVTPVLAALPSVAGACVEFLGPSAFNVYVVGPAGMVVVNDFLGSPRIAHAVDIGVDLHAPATSCAVTDAYIFVGDRWGLLAVDRGSGRGARIAGQHGAAGSSWQPLHDGAAASTVPVGAVTGVSANVNGAVMIASGVGITTIQGAAPSPVVELLYGQPLSLPGGAAPGPSQGWTSAGETVSFDEATDTLAHLSSSATIGDCMRVCETFPACTSFVVADGCALLHAAWANLTSGGLTLYVRPAVSTAAGGVSSSDARLAAPVVDPVGVCELGEHVYVIGQNRLLRLHPPTGAVVHVAGNGLASPIAADGTTAGVSTVIADGALACDAANGALYIAQPPHYCVRLLNTSTLAITTVAGTCGKGSSFSHPSATLTAAAEMGSPSGLAVADDGNTLYVATAGEHRVWRVDLLQSTRRSAVGNGTSGAAEDFGNATDVAIRWPSSVCATAAELLVVDGAGGSGSLLRVDSDDEVRRLAGTDWSGGTSFTGTTSFGGGAHSAMLVGGVKGGCGIIGGRVYLPTVLWPDGVAAFDAVRRTVRASFFGWSQPPDNLPTPPEGSERVARAAGTVVSAGSSALYIAGKGPAGGGAVWRVNASGLPTASLSFVVAPNGAQSRSLFDWPEDGVTVTAHVRFDAPLGIGNWTSIVAYDAGRLRLSVGEADGRVLVLVHIGAHRVQAETRHLTNGQWHSIAVSWRPMAGRWRVHVDGREARSGTLPTAAMRRGMRMVIGGTPPAAAAADLGLSSVPFDGSVADLAVWGTELSEAALRALRMNRRPAGTAVVKWLLSGDLLSVPRDAGALTLLDGASAARWPVGPLPGVGDVGGDPPGSTDSAGGAAALREAAVAFFGLDAVGDLSDRSGGPSAVPELSWQWQRGMGPCGDCILLHGSGSVAIGDGAALPWASLSGVAGLTVSAWARIDSATGQPQAVLALTGGADPSAGVAVELGVRDDLHPRVELFGSTVRCAAPAPVALGVWVHLSASVSLASRGGVTIYHNGVPVERCGVPPVPFEVSAWAQAAVGARVFGGAARQHGLVGAVSRVAVHRFAMSDEDAACAAALDEGCRLPHVTAAAPAGPVRGLPKPSAAGGVTPVVGPRGARAVETDASARQEIRERGIRRLRGASALTLAGWVRRSAAPSGPRLAPGVVVGVPAPEVAGLGARWCADGTMADLSGSGATPENYTADSVSDAGPDAPFAARGPACTAPFTSVADWPSEGGASAWVRFASQPGAWAQPIVRWYDSVHPGAFFELSIGPLSGGNASDPDAVIEGQWCADTAEAGDDIGPWGRHATPLTQRPKAAGSPSADIGYGPTANASTPTGVFGRLGCGFEGPSAAPLLAPPRRSFPRPGSYMAWVRASHHGSGAANERYTLIRGVALGSTYPSARVALGHCRTDGFCSAEFEAEDSANGRSGAATHRFAALDTWVHVAVTWGGDGAVRVYVDGALARYATVDRDMAGATSMLIGGDFRLGDEVNGLLYDVRVYHGLLYSGEVFRIATGRQRYAAHLRWRGGDDERLSVCGEADTEGDVLQVGSWMRVAAGWGNGSAWAGNDGNPQRSSCLGGFGGLNSSLLMTQAAKLDKAEVLGAGAYSGELNYGVTATAAVHDVRVYRHRVGVSAMPAKDAPTDWEAALMVAKSGRPSLRIAGAGDVVACSSVAAPLDSWVHIAVVWSGGDSVTWLANGEVKCESRLDGNAAVAGLAMASGREAFVGGTQWGWVLHGAVADAALFTTALPPAVIAAAAASGSIATAAAPPAALPCTLSAWWNFDDPAGAGLVADVTGAHDAKVVGGLTESGRQGTGGMLADASLGWHADVGTAAKLAMSSSPKLSLSGWVRHSAGAASGGRTILAAAADSSRPSWSEGAGPAEIGSHECFRRSRALYAFSFDEPAGSETVYSSGRHGLGGNNAVTVSNVELGVPGVHGTAIRLPSGRSRGEVWRTRRPVGGSSGGLTIMFWAKHSSTGAVEVPGKGRAALYEVAREPGEFGRALLALESTDSTFIHFAVDTEAGIQGPPRSSEHFRYGEWQHVALTMSGDTMSMYSGGALVWEGTAPNASAPWAFGRNGTVVAHYGHGYKIVHGFSCGEGQSYELPSGHTYIDGSPEDCEHVCTQYDDCEGFVYIWTGDVAPAFRCYFRSSTAYNNSSPVAVRDCYTKMRGLAAPEHAEVAFDDLVVLDWALPSECIARAVESGPAAAAADAASCGGVDPGDVLLSIPLNDPVGSVVAAAEAGLPSVLEAAADAVTFASSGGPRDSSGYATVGDHLGGGLMLMRGCWTATLSDKYKTSGSLWGSTFGDEVLSVGQLNYTVGLANGTAAAPVSLRVRAANSDAVDRTIGLAAGDAVFIMLTVPAGAGQTDWHAAAIASAADCSGGCDLVYASDSTTWTGNLTVYEVAVCPGTTEDVGCSAWRCSCQVAADEMGMGTLRNCTDVAAQAWWEANCMSNGTATYWPSVGTSYPYPACATPRDEGSMTLSWWMRASASANSRADIPGTNCSVVYAAARTAASAAVGVWNWWLCESEERGALWLQSTVTGIDAPEALSSGRADFALGTWVHVSIVVDGSTRSVYGDGTRIHRHVADDDDAPPIVWHKTAQFFPQYLGGDVDQEGGPHRIDVAEISVLGVALCPRLAARLHAVGVSGLLRSDVPCALSSPSPALVVRTSPWAFLRFDEGWLSDGGFAAADASGTENHFHAVAAPSELEVPHAGARDGVGPSLRVRRGPVAGLRGVGDTPTSSTATVAFWVSVGNPGSGAAGIFSGALSCVVCEARACDFVGRAAYGGTSVTSSAEACRDKCSAQATCVAATWLNGPGQPEHGTCTLGTEALGGGVFANILAGGAVSYLRGDDGEVFENCRSPPLARCGIAEGETLYNDTSGPRTSLADCRARCAELQCGAAEWTPEYPGGRDDVGICTLAAARNSTPGYASSPVTAFVPDTEPAFGVSVLSSSDAHIALGGSHACPNGEAMSLAIGSGAGTAAAALQLDSTPLRFRQWQHVVVTFRGSAAPDLHVNGERVRSPDLRSLPNRLSATPAVSWGTAVWAHAAEGQTGADGLVDDLAIWTRALTEAEALTVWRGAVGLSPALAWHGGAWHHVTWTLGGGEQRWYVDGDEVRRCPAAEPLSFSSAGEHLRLGLGYQSEGFRGSIDDVRMYRATVSEADVAALYRGVDWKPSLRVEAPAAPPAAHEAPEAESSVGYEAPAWPWQDAADAPVLLTTPATPGLDCAGCSTDCSHPCHESVWHFDDAPPGYVDSSGNDRNAMNDGAVVTEGVFGSPGISDGGGGGVLIPAWEGLAGSRLTWLAWVRPDAEMRGVLVSMEGSDVSSNASFIVTQNGEDLCATAGALECCAGASVLIAERWTHVGVAAALDTGALTIFRSGAAVKVCRGPPGASAFDPPSRGIGLMKPVAAHGLGGEPSFVGSMDEVRISTAERTAYDAAAAARDFVCADCGPSCAPAGIVAPPHQLRADGGVSLSATEAFHRGPFGGAAARVAGSEGGELSRLWCRRSAETDAVDDMLVGVFVMPLAAQGGGDVVIPAPTASLAGCSVVCQTGDPNSQHAVKAVPRGCPAGAVHAGARHRGGGWYHCVARFRASPPLRRRISVHVTAGEPVLFGGLHWQTGAACGDGVLGFPGEDCDTAQQWRGDASGVCDSNLCLLPDNPFVSDADVQFVHSPPAPPQLQLVLHPSHDGELSGLRVFLSARANCSDRVDREAAVTNAAGTALIDVEGGGLPVTEAEQRYLCLPLWLHEDPSAATPARRWVSATAPEEFVRVTVLPCVDGCQNGGACNPLTGACSCPFGYTGPSCAALLDGCAVGPAGAECEEVPSSTLPLPTLELWSGSSDGPRFRENPCASAACVANGGSCRMPGICTCPLGFAPPDCDGCVAGRTGPLCDDPDCSGSCGLHGTCAAEAGGGAVCRCDDGWLGRRCDRQAALFSGGTGDVVVSDDGRRLWRPSHSTGPLRLLAVFPHVGVPELPVWFAITAGPASSGVSVGFCASEGVAAVGDDSVSWGVRWDGTSLLLSHAGETRRAGPPPRDGDAVTVRWEPASGVVFAAVGAGAPFAAFEHACTDVCFGCLSAPPGASVQVLDHS